jgi:hypothetical protein
MIRFVDRFDSARFLFLADAPEVRKTLENKGDLPEKQEPRRRLKRAGFSKNPMILSDPELPACLLGFDERPARQHLTWTSALTMECAHLQTRRPPGRL